MSNVNEMYKYCKTLNKPLLSSYTSDFWNYYLNNFTEMDNMFMKLYRSFRYLYDDGSDIDYMTEDFISTVYNWLLLNDTRYNQLFKSYIAEYDVLRNYDITETYEGSNNRQGADIYGQRTDVDNTLIGNQSAEDINKVTAFNTNNENTKTSNKVETGTRNDIEQFTKGSQTDTHRVMGDDEHTLQRFGNIGVQTSPDMLKKHNDYWIVYNLYMLIFGEIAEQFLLVD